MRGHFDDSFFESSNKVFICLVSSALCHASKSCTTRVYVELPKAEEFKYSNTVRTYVPSDAACANVHINRDMPKVSRYMSGPYHECPRTAASGNQS